MSTKELQDALQRQKVSLVTEDYLLMLTQLLGLDQETLARVTWAYSQLINYVPGELLEMQFPFWEKHMPAKLMEAIKLAVQEGSTATYLARAIMNSRTISVRVDLMLPPERMNEICNGCPESLPCLADNLHTPKECYTERKYHLTVFPLSMTKTHVIVEAPQPHGKYTVPINKLRIPFSGGSDHRGR